MDPSLRITISNRMSIFFILLHSQFNIMNNAKVPCQYWLVIQYQYTSNSRIFLLFFLSLSLSISSCLLFRFHFFTRTVFFFIRLDLIFALVNAQYLIDKVIRCVEIQKKSTSVRNFPITFNSFSISSSQSFHCSPNPVREKKITMFWAKSSWFLIVPSESNFASIEYVCVLAYTYNIYYYLKTRDTFYPIQLPSFGIVRLKSV